MSSPRQTFRWKQSSHAAGKNTCRRHCSAVPKSFRAEWVGKGGKWGFKRLGLRSALGFSHFLAANTIKVKTYLS